MIWNGISDMLVGRGLVPVSAHARHVGLRSCLQHVRPQPVGNVIPACGRIPIASCVYEVELLVGIPRGSRDARHLGSQPLCGRLSRPGLGLMTRVYGVLWQRCTARGGACFR